MFLKKAIDVSMAKLSTHITYTNNITYFTTAEFTRKKSSKYSDMETNAKNRRILTLNSLITFITHFKPILNFCTPEKIKKPLLF